MPCSRVLQQSHLSQYTGCFSSSWKSPSLRRFCSDVKAAHKSIRVRESDQGLLGIQAGGQYTSSATLEPPFRQCGSRVWVLDITASLCIAFCGCFSIRLVGANYNWGPVWSELDGNSISVQVLFQSRRKGETDWLTLFRQCFTAVPRSIAEMCKGDWDDPMASAGFSHGPRVNWRILPRLAWSSGYFA